jgi:hypothetical protein
VLQKLLVYFKEGPVQPELKKLYPQTLELRIGQELQKEHV